MYNGMTLSEIGNLLHHWHCGMMDPIYMVGSYFVNGEDYPDLEVVAQANDILSGIESKCCIPDRAMRRYQARTGRPRRQAKSIPYVFKHGLGYNEFDELINLIDALVDYLQEKGYYDE